MYGERSGFIWSYGGRPQSRILRRMGVEIGNLKPLGINWCNIDSLSLGWRQSILLGNDTVVQMLSVTFLIYEH